VIIFLHTSAALQMQHQLLCFLSVCRVLSLMKAASADGQLSNRTDLTNGGFKTTLSSPRLKNLHNTGTHTNTI